MVGAILIVVGLYSVLWGKYKEHKEKETETIPKCSENGRVATMEEDIEGRQTEMQSKEKSPAAAEVTINVGKA